MPNLPTNLPTVRLLNDFRTLRDALPALASPAGSDLFSTLDWFDNLATHGLPDSIRLCLAVLGDGPDACCLPLASGMPSSEFSDSALLGLSNYYSCLFGPLGNTAAHGEAAWRALFRTLREARAGWPLISLQPLDPTSAFFTQARAALAAEGYWTDSYFCFGNWYLDVAGRDYAAYFAGLPGQLRSNIERGRRKLDRAGSWQLRILAAPGDGLEQAIADFHAVYRQSWKRPEPFPGFIPGLCRMAAAHGWLRLGVLTYREQPIASQIWFVKEGRALIYKLAYDQSHPRLSAGTVLSAAMMRHVIDADRVHEVDYLSGDDEYKRDWMSHRRERYGIVAYDPATVRGLLAGLRHFAGKLGKQAFAATRKNSAVTHPAIG